MRWYFSAPPATSPTRRSFPRCRRSSRGGLDIPIIGIARQGWNLDKLRDRMRDSLEHNGGVDPAAFEKLSANLQYIDGDYTDPETFTRLKAA